MKIDADDILVEPSDTEPGVAVLTARNAGNIVLVVRMAPDGFNRFAQSFARTAHTLFAEQVNLALVETQPDKKL